MDTKTGIVPVRFVQGIHMRGMNLLNRILFILLLLIPTPAFGQRTGGSFGGSRWGNTRVSTPSSTFRSYGTTPVSRTRDVVGSTTQTPSVGTHDDPVSVTYDGEGVDVEMTDEGIGIFLCVVGLGILGTVIAILIGKVKEYNRRRGILSKKGW